MKKSFILDSIGTTVFAVFFLFVISKIDINLDILNPVSKTFEDFEITDLVFSQIRENPPADTNIVLVNIGNLSRAEIAAQIDTINKYNPLVIGIDARFLKPKRADDPYRDSLAIWGDSALSRAIANTKNMVMACKLYANAEKQVIDSVQYSHPMFMKNADAAFVNTISEGENRFKTWRDQNLFEKVNGQEMLAFSTKIASFFNQDKINVARKRGKDTEIINFKGNIDCATIDNTPNAKITFGALDAYQVLNEEFDPSMVRNKIIIMGYMGESFSKYSTEDRFFTPLNKNYVGRADQDMYGVIVHANIVSMVINSDYLNEQPEFWNMVMNIILVFLNILLFSYLYTKLEMFWDGATILISLLESLLFVTVIVIVFDKYGYILNFTMATVASFLMPNIIELYFGLVKASIVKIRNRFSKVETAPNPESNVKSKIELTKKSDNDDEN